MGEPRSWKGRVQGRHALPEASIKIKVAILDRFSSAWAWSIGAEHDFLLCGHAI
jgi:hypothetical protein